MNNIILNGGVTYLEKYNDAMKIIVKKPSILIAINLNESFNLKIIIENGASLVMTTFDMTSNLDLKFDVDLLDNSKFCLNSLFISEGDYNLDIFTKLNGNNSMCDVRVRGISAKKGNTNIVLNGENINNTKDNVINEYVKIINRSEENNIVVPNLLINSSLVQANHGVSIGKINSDELFYLMSKGIRKSEAISMIEEGFLLSELDEDIKMKIKNVLMGR